MGAVKNTLLAAAAIAGLGVVALKTRAGQEAARAVGATDKRKRPATPAARKRRRPAQPKVAASSSKGPKKAAAPTRGKHARKNAAPRARG
jgi:hypothetical protein